MKQTFLYLTLLFLFAVAVTGCSKDDDYNADTALSYYHPQEYDKMVSSITVTSKVENKDYSWTYNFLYDAQNRIKEIYGDAKYYVEQDKPKINSYVERTHSSKYYYDNEILKVEFFNNEYIIQHDYNNEYSGDFYGHFDKEDGKIVFMTGKLGNVSFGSFDCEYEGLMLSRVYTDYATSFALEYDRNNNIVKTYQVDSIDNIIEKTVKEYKYSNYKNKTNIDFASFLGYNIAERNILCNTYHPYELFHLGAFEMFGGRGTYLPKGEWTFDEGGFPVKYISPEDRVYTITYKE